MEEAAAVTAADAAAEAVGASNWFALSSDSFDCEGALGPGPSCRQAHFEASVLKSVMRISISSPGCAMDATAGLLVGILAGVVLIAPMSTGDR